jgi:hypothetical protein
LNESGILEERVERRARPSLDQREARIGDVYVQYCAARRRSGEWFAVGNVVRRAGVAQQVSRLVSGSGATELGAVERMLLRAAQQTRAEAAVK